MGILLSKPQPDSIVQQQRTIYPALSGLRFFAASIVFVFHNQGLFPETESGLFRAVIAEFHVGVSVFFVLSGFLIAHLFGSKTLEKPKAYFKYLAIRFARVYPLYWAILAVLHLQWLFAVPELIAHLTLLKGYFHKLHLKGIGQAWSLSVELSFYFFAPFIHKALLRGSAISTFFAISLIGIGLWGIGSGLSALNLNSSGFMADLKFVAYSTFFGRASDFFAGMLLYNLVILREKKWSISWFSPTYEGIILLIISCIIQHTFHIPGTYSYTWGGLVFHHTVLPLIVVIFIYGLIQETTVISRLFSNKYLILLGNASYVFYLMHFGWLNNWLILNITTEPIVLFVILWALSIVIYFAFDKPVYVWLRKKISAL